MATTPDATKDHNRSPKPVPAEKPDDSNEPLGHVTSVTDAEAEELARAIEQQSDA